MPFSVQTLVPEDLFSGKMHAVLCRGWKNRVKGRDWYDLLWYVLKPEKVRHLSRPKQALISPLARPSLALPDAGMGMKILFVILLFLPALPAKCAELRRLHGHGDYVTRIATHPHRESFAVSFALNATLIAWDLETGHPYWKVAIAVPEEQEVPTLAFSRSGDAVVVGGTGGFLHVFASETGREIADLSPQTRGLGKVRAATFGPGDRLLLVSMSNTLLVWDVETFGTPRRLDVGFGGTRIVVSGDARRIAIGGFGSSVALVDMTSGAMLRTVPAVMNATFLDFALSPDLQFVAGSVANGVELYDVETGGKIAFYPVPSPVPVLLLLRIAFARDAGTLAAFSADGRSFAWDLTTGQARVTDLGAWIDRDYDFIVDAPVQYSASGRYLLTGEGRDMSIRVWGVAP